MSIITHRTKILKEAAERLGFMGVGIAKAEMMDDEARKLEAWLAKGYHGEMGYMANHFDKRVDPTQLVPGAKSVISLMYNYFPGDAAHCSSEESPHSNFKVSRYASGEDYHKVIRRKLKALVVELKETMGDFYGRVFVDSAPVMERDWAKRSGLGWAGKNTLIIHPRKGSYFFLAEIILDIEFDYDHPIRDHCGTCTRCIDACPTEAISTEGYVLDASKCISYLTIELKSAIPESFHDKMEDWIFGCDICQEVCPWNRFSSPHNEPAFTSNEKRSGMQKRDWMEMTEEIFLQLFEKTPLIRPGFEKMKSTIQMVSAQNLPLKSM